MTQFRSRYNRRRKRQNRIRKKVQGSSAIPRLAVFRSAKHIYVQAVDDSNGVTLAAASTMDKECREQVKGNTGNCAAAAVVGQSIAGRLKAKGIEQACFDRGGNRYHGRVKALADGAREAGLKI